MKHGTKHSQKKTVLAYAAIKGEIYNKRPKPVIIGLRLMRSLEVNVIKPITVEEQAFALYEKNLAIL